MRRLLPELLAALLVSLITAGGLLLDSVEPARKQGLSLADIFLGHDERVVLVGTGVDLVGTVWTFDRVHRMLTGQSSIHDPTVFAPVGLDTGAAQGFAWLDAAFAAPLTHLLGAAGGYNLWLLFALVATQLACFALMRQVGAALPVALGFSVVAVGNPFVFNEVILGRPTQVTLVFHALFFLFTHRMLARGRWHDGAIAGAFLAASCYVYWFGGVAIGITGAAAATLHLLLVKERRREIVVAGLALCAAAMLLTVLPTWRLSGAVLSGEGASWIYDLSRQPKPLLDLGFFSLETRGEWMHIRHPLELHRRLVEIQVPWTLLGVLLLAIPRDRAGVAWWLSGWFAMSIPISGVVVIGGVGILTGLGLAELIFPPVARCHHIERLVVAALLVGSMVGAMALSRLRHPALQWGAGLLIGGLALFEAHERTTARIWITDAAQLLEEVAAEHPGGIIDVPVSASNEAYYRQVFHRQAILGGPGINGPFTRPEEHITYCNDNTVLAALEGMAMGAVMADFSADDLQALWDDGFRVVVMHRAAMRRPPDFEGLEAAGFSLWGRDDGMIAFLLPTPPAP